MSRKIVLLMALALFVLTRSAAANVYVHNTTDQLAEVTSSSWTEPSGRTMNLSLTWQVKPGHRILLASSDAATIRATEFRWRLSIGQDESPDAGRVWITSSDVSGNIEIRIDNTVLPAPSGAIHIDNSTDWQLTIREAQYLDRTGQWQTISGQWVFEPGRSAFLTYNGARIQARRFVATIETGRGLSTRWAWNDRTRDDERLSVKIRYQDIAPPSWWTGSVQPGGSSEWNFAAPRGPRTLVFKLENESRTGDVDIEVVDSSGNVVARSDRPGNVADRCMLHVNQQDTYTVRVVSHDSSNPIRFRVVINEVCHVRALGAAAAKEAAEGVALGLLVGLIGSDEDKQAFWKDARGQAIRDAMALAVMYAVMELQRLDPEIDPLTEFASLADRLKDDDGYVLSIRNRFLDEITQRIHEAAN